jgi:HK97 family phage prohead protease
MARDIERPQRAWSALQIKSIDEEQRVLQGIASSISTDRVGDVVMPRGAQFKLPLPFLWQHDASQPVGHVTAATPNDREIPVTIKMAQTNAPGIVKDRLDAAWHDIQLGLVRGLSIGFAPLEYAYMEDTGGYRFERWNWLELSGVTIPANESANITTVKRFDLASMPASRQRSHSGSVPLPFLKPEPPVFPKTWGEITPSGFMGKLALKMLPTVGDIMVEALAPMLERISALESAMAQHKYFGVWKGGQYKQHNSVTHKGSLWIALRDTEGTPGMTEDWQLAVKRGRDGRGD